MLAPARALAALSGVLAFAGWDWEAAPSPPPPSVHDASAADAGLTPRPAPRTPARPMSFLGADWLTRPEREAEEQPERMLDALQLRAGDTVADVGAGVGYHAWRLSARVGPAGKVYATDIQPEMLELLRKNIAQRGLTNVIPVQATRQRTGLPDGSVDVLLLVDVYHEAADPQGFLRQLRRALKPTGRLVLVEFRAEDPDLPVRPEHKLSAEQAIAELTEGGFQLSEQAEFLPRQHLLVFVPQR
jgi:protein-L-isoaspartate O-methyltransferase